jgi:hypothetical protein
MMMTMGTMRKGRSDSEAPDESEIGSEVMMAKMTQETKVQANK